MTTFVITGASDGIGAELARQLAARHGASASLVLAARSPDKLERVAQDCARSGAATFVVPTDVARQEACRALVDQAVARFGGIDVLVNNAGVSAHALFASVAPDDLHWYRDLMDINLWGAVWCTHAALPHLKAARGQVVAVSSLAGLVGVPGRTAYSATKFAVTGFFEALRTELQPSGVAVTVAYPGVVATGTRRNGWNAQGRTAGRSGLKEDDAMPVDACVRRLLQGMEARDREILFSPRDRLARFLKLLSPRTIDRLSLQALADEERPR